MGRVDNARKNIIYGYLGNILSLIIKFISRTAFIYTIGATYLGVNGLYSNVLSILSFAELGIGTAMNYSLYAPVADNDKDKIKAIMHLYKKSYRIIALIIAVVGLILIPFLPIVINDAGGISNKELIIYYLIFLYNTVSTYFVSYKYSLVNADQKNYIQTNIQTITNLIIVPIQIISLFMFQSFLVYLLIQALVQTGQIFFVNKYLNKRYPILIEDDSRKLTKEEITPIKNNIKALMFHKIGEISVYSSDDIVISAFINLRTVGLMSNYNLIMNSVHTFITIIFNSIVSGIGNFIATENKENQFRLFNVYFFSGFWIFGFAIIAFSILLNPFIELWLGKEMLLSNSVVYLLTIDYYFRGHRIIVNNFKTAAGVFDADKYLAIVQAVVNIVLSIILVQFIGLPGVYIATLLQGLIANFFKPIITYKAVFDKKPYDYFKKSTIYFLVVIATLILLEAVKNIVLVETTVIRFLVLMVAVVIIPNLLFTIIFFKTEEFQQLFNLIKAKRK